MYNNVVYYNRGPYTKRVNKYQQQGIELQEYLLNIRDPEKRLWLSVVFQAFADIRKGLPEDQQTAHDFLSGKSGMLTEICKICHWNDKSIMKYYYDWMKEGLDD